MKDSKRWLICLSGLLFSNLLLNSCSLLIPDTSKDKKFSNYQVERPKGWKITSKANADYAFINPKSASIIFTNSICDKYSQARLPDLGKNILRSVDNFSAPQPQKTTLANRDAYRWCGHGKMDGVPVNLDYLIVRKSNCIFDLVLISTENDLWPQDQTSFNQFLSTLKIP